MGVGIWWCLIIGCGGNVFGVYVGSIIVYVMLCCLCICDTHLHVESRAGPRVFP